MYAWTTGTLLVVDSASNDRTLPYARCPVIEYTHFRRRGGSVSVGEDDDIGLIAGILARLPQGSSSLLGPGDDAAVVRATDGRVVASTDLMLEGRHFRRD